MIQAYTKTKELINSKRLLSNTKRLFEKEFPQTFSAYHSSAREAQKIMREMNFTGIELLEFPANGKNVYQDKCMPLAWKVSKGKLTIIKSGIEFKTAIIADYQQHPFHIARGSVSIDKKVRVITEAQMFAGFDVKNCLIICEPTTPPTQDILRTALDLGAIGLILDFKVDGLNNPDSIHWINALTEGPNWHVELDDRDFVCFSISRRNGDMLRKAANSSEVIAHAECDGRRYESTIPAVTGIIPGKTNKEIWFLAHLQEPLADDNSLGVASALETAHAIRQYFAPQHPYYTIRVVLANELYGFAAFIENKQYHNLIPDVVYANNFDGTLAMKGARGIYYASPAGSPCFGDLIFKNLFEDIKYELPFSAEYRDEGTYSCDCCFADSTIGLPISWFHEEKMTINQLWHNSSQTMNLLDKDICEANSAVIATGVCILNDFAENPDYALKRLLASAKRNVSEEMESLIRNKPNNSWHTFAMSKRAERETERIRSFEKAANVDTKPIIEQLHKFVEMTKLFLEKNTTSNPISTKMKHNPILEYADTIIPARKTAGFPQDLKNIPKNKRKTISNQVMYGPFANIMSNMDGKKTLKELILEAEWEAGKDLSKNIFKYIRDINYLTEHGYIETQYKSLITQKEIVIALEKAGIKKGDTVMLHSGLSQNGLIEGGAESIIQAFIEVLGKEGTLMMPAFSCPYTTHKRLARRSPLQYKPYDPSDTSQIITGAVPQAFHAWPEVIHSDHPTHSVLAIGLNADILLQHEPMDFPVGDTSPFAFLPELDAKMVFMGADLSTSTYLHYIEYKGNAPYLESALITIKTNNGIKQIFYPENLLGCRDFGTLGGETKIYQKLRGYGLKINTTPLGLGDIKVIRAKPAYELASKAFKENPNILLCDQDDCSFCSSYKN